MAPVSDLRQRLFLIDDDLLSREVLALLAVESGFSVESFSSGEAALAHLANQDAERPLAILIDMQMPDLSGDALAHQLRSVCGRKTLLLAMSGTPVLAKQIQHFDAFILKPFVMDNLRRVIAGSVPGVSLWQAPETSLPAPLQSEALNETTYESLAGSMPHDQLMQLYKMCLDDADRRIGLMREAVAKQDAETFLRGAHSIKGCCGMVGALELAALAAEMEERGLPEVDDVISYEQFMEASGRLRRILGTLQK